MNDHVREKLCKAKRLKNGKIMNPDDSPTDGGENEMKNLLHW